jgi:hypothetical protein
LTSEIDIIADIEDLGSPAVVKEVLWPEIAPLKPGDRIVIERLGECQPLSRRDGEVVPHDVSAPGLYLVPLRRVPGRQGHYEVAPIPQSPGFDAGKVPVRVYPASPETRTQYHQVEKP